MAILRRCLQRDPTRRFESAAEMGEACEHFLYDKGYGPTNLTLKQKLAELFPPSPPSPEDEGEDALAALEASLIPIDDGAKTAPPPTPGPRRGPAGS
jgi:hypothetical protein